MASDIQPISGEEFRQLGYLQEVNRQVLHPLGLALYNDQGWSRERVEKLLQEQGVQFGEDAIDNIMTFLARAGLMEEHIAGALDDRSDPEGWQFAVRADHLEEDMAEFTRKRINIEGEWTSRSLTRIANLGYIVQEDIHVPGMQPLAFGEDDEPVDDEPEVGSVDSASLPEGS
jgi:hypothetical protein